MKASQPGYNDCLRVIFDPAVTVYETIYTPQKPQTHTHKLKLCVLLISDTEAANYSTPSSLFV